MKIDSVFHVSLLKLAASDSYSGQIQDLLPLVVIDEKEEYQGEEVLNSRTRWRKLEYLVKWIGYAEPDSMGAWIISGLAAINKFYALYSERPRPLPQYTK